MFIKLIVNYEGMHSFCPNNYKAYIYAPQCTTNYTGFCCVGFYIRPTAICGHRSLAKEVLLDLESKNKNIVCGKNIH